MQLWKKTVQKELGFSRRTYLTMTALFLKCVKHTSTNRGVTRLFTWVVETNILQFVCFCWLHQCRHQAFKGVQISVSIWRWIIGIISIDRFWKLYLDSINHLQIVFRHLIKYQRDTPVECKWFLWQNSVTVNLWVILKIKWQTRPLTFESWKMFQIFKKLHIILLHKSFKITWNSLTLYFLYIFNYLSQVPEQSLIPFILYTNPMAFTVICLFYFLKNNFLKG